ncbi:peptide-methionine (S)-S-oxide reductase [Photobacterium atrarenae]|uniref:peptide-methionine (S)-S-oxide reductase n=1 Tax=Photobacterium atrarenae TaxID=865757 RepID=A0ABY5GLE8_9GAMM|nr:peptide-methionine (S)-S-oxide reductase [Photobacterium atrarenae]UTV30139.1 peptide-methionine (S)-S-oxide reductase [Photobacterium atrarenae]
MAQIGFGGSCYWCMEAVFRSIRGVSLARSVWFTASLAPEPSEGVTVTFDEDVIDLQSLIHIHLSTHSCTEEHALRKKYRSAVYVYDSTQAVEAGECLQRLQVLFPQPIVTQVLEIDSFRTADVSIQDYYYSDPGKPFCCQRITPKLRILLREFAAYVDPARQAVIESQDSGRND